jgi:hypothetical protein
MQRRHCWQLLFGIINFFRFHCNFFLLAKFATKGKFSQFLLPYDYHAGKFKSLDGVG